jgi:hypothetical protein
MTLRLTRLLVATPILASIALMSPASGRAPATMPSCTQAESAKAPSRLDYLLIASLADSSNLLALAAYRTPEKGLPEKGVPEKGLRSD